MSFRFSQIASNNKKNISISDRIYLEMLTVQILVGYAIFCASANKFTGSIDGDLSLQNWKESKELLCGQIYQRQSSLINYKSNISDPHIRRYTREIALLSFCC